MDNKKQYFVQDAHSVLQGNNSLMDMKVAQMKTLETLITLSVTKVYQVEPQPWTVQDKKKIKNKSFEAHSKDRALWQTIMLGLV